MLNIDRKVITLLMATLVGMFCGWQLASGHYQKEINQNMQEVAEYVAGVTTERNTYNAEIERLNGDIKRADADFTLRLATIQAEKDDLSRRLANGTSGLRVKAICPTSATSGAKAGSGAGMGEATTAELDPSLRPTYLALREGLKTQYEELVTLREILLSCAAN